MAETPQEQWDIHWQRIYDDAIEDGETPNTAVHIADRETTEQFGERPEEG